MPCSEHHATHIWELNKALLKHPDLQDMDLVTLNRHVGTEKIPADIAAVIRKHGGQGFCVHSRGICVFRTLHMWVIIRWSCCYLSGQLVRYDVCVYRWRAFQPQCEQQIQQTHVSNN